MRVRLRSAVEGRAPTMRLGVWSVEEAREAVRRYVEAHRLRPEEFAPAEVFDHRGRRVWFISHGGTVTDAPWCAGRRRERPHRLPANFGQPVYD